jgi:hypothetical protein
MNPQHEALLFELKHHRVFPALDNSTYLHNPYILAMIKIQSFTQAVTAFLEQPNSPQQGLISAIWELYDGTPSFYEQLAFGKCVKDAMLKHPLQRTAKQYQWLSVVAMITDIGIETKAVPQIVWGAISAREEWKERVLSPSNLPIDQDYFYIFTQKHGLTTPLLPLSSALANDHCPICFLPFSEETGIVPQEAPCAHFFCARCIPKWIAKATKICTCPLCRACLVCGSDRVPCAWHTLWKPELAPPTPLPEILDQVLPEKTGVVLHGIQPNAYFVLRERTRKDRSWLEGLTKWMDRAVRMGDHPGKATIAADYEVIVERVRGEIVKALRES